MRGGNVVTRMEEPDARVCRGHPERCEDALFHKIVPALACGGRDDLSCCNVEHVIVCIPAAEARCRLDVAEPLEDFLAAVVRVKPEKVACAESESAPVREQVGHGELPRHVWVIELEPREMVDDQIIPAKLPFVDEDCKGRRGERLRVRRDLEDRARINRCWIAQPADAVSFREHNLSVFYDCDGGTRNLEFLHCLRDVGIEIVRGIGLRAEPE